MSLPNGSCIGLNRTSRPVRHSGLCPTSYGSTGNGLEMISSLCWATPFWMPTAKPQTPAAWPALDESSLGLRHAPRRGCFVSDFPGGVSH